MEGLKSIAKKSQKVLCEDNSTWLSLFYNIEEKKAYTTGGVNRRFVTYLINPCTEEDIENAIKRWLYI